MLHYRLLILTFAAFLGGCMTPPTISSRPEAYLPVVEGKFRAADEAKMVDCIFDGFLDSQAAPGSTLVRQTRREAGYRVAVAYGPTQLLVADIRYTGDLVVTRLANSTFFNVDLELGVAKSCLAKYATK